MALRWRYETWRKLYIREEGSFAQLPFFARALAKQLICYADDDGCIALGGRDPVSAIAFRGGGADLSDRRLLKKYIPALLADGYLVREGDALRIRNFPDAQGRDRVRVAIPVAEVAPFEGAPDVTETRPERDIDTTSTRAEHESDTRTEVTVENQTTPFRSSVPSEKREEISLARKARQDLIGTVWSSHRAMRERLHAELALPDKLQPLHDLSPGRSELAARLLERADDTAAALEACEHVLSIGEAEARAKKTLKWLDGGIWRADRFAKALAMSVADVAPRQPPKAAGPKWIPHSRRAFRG